MTSIPIPEQEIPEKLLMVPPAQLPGVITRIQRWTGDAIMKVAGLVEAVSGHRARSAAVLATLNEWKVESDEQYVELIQTQQIAKGHIKDLEEQRIEITKPVNGAIGRVNDLVKDGKEGWERVSAKVDQMARAFRDERERKRREEENRLRQIAAKQAEEERLKAEKKAEKLEAAGKVDQAQAVREAVPAGPPPAPIVTAPPLPRVTGAGGRAVAPRVYWHHRIINKDLVPDNWWIRVINTDGLEAFAKATKGTVQVTGVEFYSDEKYV